MQLYWVNCRNDTGMTFYSYALLVIIAFQNRPEMPAMERIYRQIILCNKELALEGYGKAALINIDDYCANDIEKTSGESNCNNNVEPMIF